MCEQFFLFLNNYDELRKSLTDFLGNKEKQSSVASP